MAKLTFKDLAKEDTIMEILGVNEKALAELRNKEDLPYVRVNRNSRLYLVPDVMEWLKSRTCSGRISNGDDSYDLAMNKAFNEVMS